MSSEDEKEYPPDDKVMNRDTSAFNFKTGWEEEDEQDTQNEWDDPSSDGDIFGNGDDQLSGEEKGEAEKTEMDQIWKGTSPFANSGSKPKPKQKPTTEKKEFNPWQELDKASKKSVSRRDLLRGVCRFLPDENEK